MRYGFQEYHPAALLEGHLHMGDPGPAGKEIRINSRYLERGGKPWIGIMGEYHFVRDHRENWPAELRKMKAGGITIVGTYVFWIYHEEQEGEVDFSGDLDLRAFVQACGEAGLSVFLRIGPWAHGECRNGGFPDWLLGKPFPLRQDHPGYLSLVRRWYEQIFRQVQGLFYRDGGPIIGVQIENELVDAPDHLLTLKRLAAEIGFDVPIYTATGWNSRYGAKIPVEEFLPVFGAYVEAPWEAHTDRLPLSWHYVFDPQRNDAAVGKDLIGETDDTGWRLPYERYPFATCELGAGLPVSHHRRAVVSGRDAYALSLVKLGCGNNLVGYYMYHGGTNRIGRLSTLQESRATGYPNDYAILNYDFHTCLTQYGEVREQYRLLNLLHLFVNDFGELLAPMEYVGGMTKADPDDLRSLRYCMRTDGDGGFVFLSNYQRLAAMEEMRDVTIDTGTVVFPTISLRSGLSLILPFRIPIAGRMLTYATGQLLCRTEGAVFFLVPNGIPFRMKWEDGEEMTLAAGSTAEIDGLTVVALGTEEARFLRKLSGSVYLGQGVDLYEYEGRICSAELGSYLYRRWTGDGFEEITVERPFRAAMLKRTAVSEPFRPPYEEELNLGGSRRRTWYRIEVTSPEGFVEIPDVCDVSQIYTDGELAADNYYCGEPWRIPAALICGKEAYLVLSEWKDDFYREF